MTRAVIFDLDGTLADTPTAIAGLLTRVVGEQGVAVTPEQVAPTIGKPLGPSIASLIGCLVEDRATADAVARYRDLFDTEVLSRGSELLYPGVAEGLQSLQEQGFGLAVATSKISASAEKLFAATGIRSFFGPVIGNDMVEQGKPAPDMGLLAARELGMLPERCTYVGDTVTDMQMAAAAGMTPLAVTYGVGSRHELLAHSTRCCDSFAGVLAALKA
ncbi:HAD family hydrolase [Streptomyces sp. NPDC002790]|uniref:HAD family hydrolase n=1 Tax=Streptomyces sp. NPDC002790 TaxID=3154431 RepID=UPI00332723CA